MIGTLVVVAIVAAISGFYVGRATKSTAPAGAQPSWQPLPQAPIAGRVNEGVVWTGDEMLVWGGTTKSGSTSDGAAYDPAKNTWHTIARAPARFGGPAVWTGETAAAWTGNSPDGPAVGAVYDPKADRWHVLPAGPLGPREGYAAVWDGKELLIIGGARGDAQATPVAGAVDPTTGAWRVLHGLDKLVFFGGPNGAVWDGSEVLMTGNLSLCPEKGSACNSLRPTFVAYNPATDAVRALKLPPLSADFGADTAGSLKPIAWTGIEAIFTASVPGSIRIFMYDPASASWKKGAPGPCYIPPQFTQTAWAGDQFAAACGTDGLQLYVPKSETWSTISPGPSPLNSRESSAIVWTGTDLVAWSGSADKRVSPNPLPDDGASLALGG